MSKEMHLSIGSDGDSSSPRRVALSLTLAALIAVLPNLAPSAGAQTGRPVIKIVATGGTIAQHAGRTHQRRAGHLRTAGS